MVCVCPSMTLMKINKQTVVALAVAAGALSLQPLTRAAESREPAQRVGEGRLAAARERMQETARELNLTDEQKQKLQSIVRERTEKLRALRQDNNLTREEKMEKFRTAREEINAEVKKVLTPEQFQKWQARRGALAGGAARPGARLQEGIRELNLTTEQKQQLRPLYQEQMEKLRELWQDTSLTMAEKLEKAKTLHKEMAPKLKKVLDAEQYARLEKQVSQWMEQARQRLTGQREN